MTVLLGNGKGEFTASPSSPIKIPAPRAMFITLGAADITRRTATSSPARWQSRRLRQHSAGRWPGEFQAGSAVSAAHGHRGWHVAFVDYDHDGTLDLISVNEKDIRIHWGDGRAGSNRIRRSSPPAARVAGNWPFGDLNEDGFLDAVTPNVESRNLTVPLLSRSDAKKTNP